MPVLSEWTQAPQAQRLGRYQVAAESGKHTPKRAFLKITRLPDARPFLLLTKLNTVTHSRESSLTMMLRLAAGPDLAAQPGSYTHR